MIVGHKVERYLTKARVKKNDYIVTHHQIITELHATKGWRVVSRERKHHRVDRLPTHRQWREAIVCVFVPTEEVVRKRHDRPLVARLKGIRP